jgi:hypothetical protein
MAENEYLLGRIEGLLLGRMDGFCVGGNVGLPGNGLGRRVGERVGLYVYG